jgi:hypothetical protein
MFAYVCTNDCASPEVYESKRGYLVGPPGFEPGTSCTQARNINYLQA